MRPYVHADLEELGGLGNSTERMVYLVIRSFPQDRGCYLGLREIGHRAGCNKDTVSEKIKSLINKGKIKNVGQTTTVGGTVNVYKVSSEQTLKASDEQTLGNKVSSLPDKVSSLPDKVSGGSDRELKRIRENKNTKEISSSPSANPNRELSKETLETVYEAFERKYFG